MRRNKTLNILVIKTSFFFFSQNASPNKMLMQIFMFLCITPITLGTPLKRFETDERSNSVIVQKSDEANEPNQLVEKRRDVLRGIAKRDEYDMMEPTYELGEDEKVEKRRPVMRGVANFNEEDMIKRASEHDGDDREVEKRRDVLRGIAKRNGGDMKNAATERESSARGVAKRNERGIEKRDEMSGITKRQREMTGITKR